MVHPPLISLDFITLTSSSSSSRRRRRRRRRWWLWWYYYRQLRYVVPFVKKNTNALLNLKFNLNAPFPRTLKYGKLW